jgi:hypothetical protein
VGEQFWQQVLAAALGELIGGAIVALAIGVGVAFYASERLGVRQWVAAQRHRRRSEAEAALRYLRMVEGEIREIVGWIPGQLEKLKASPWGRLVPIMSPVWDVVRQRAEFAGLVDPALVAMIAHFYDILAFAKFSSELTLQSWFAEDLTSSYMEEFRTHVRGGTIMFIQEAQQRAGRILEFCEAEKRRLRLLAEQGGDGDARRPRRE